MKINRKLAVTAAATAMVLTVAGINGSYVGVGDDGIAASPRLRQMLDDQASVSDPTVETIDRSMRVASPKAQAFLDSFNRISGVSSGDTVNRELMAMSPRAHQFLSENGFYPQPQIAVLADTPATDTPATTTPVTDTPITDPPASTTPVTDTPVYNKPAYDPPVSDKPVYDPPPDDLDDLD